MQIAALSDPTHGGQGQRYAVIGTDLPDSVIFKGQDVIAGLSRHPKLIDSIYYYDDRGSVLFEQLCKEPAYYLTRTERGILIDAARGVARLTGNCTLVELGCGNCEKTKTLLQAYAREYGRVSYVPIDINRHVLMTAGREITQALPEANVFGIVGEYRTALTLLPAAAEPKCFVFLGSSIGNLDDDEIDQLLFSVRSASSLGDHFLVGADLHKASPILEAAYNNQTAILSNLCVLTHLNWRFEGNFDIFKYRHVAFHNRERERMEAHLEAVESHDVRLGTLDFSFRIDIGERIRTEIMRKFSRSSLLKCFVRNGFEYLRSWSDPSRYFGLFLFRCS